MDITEIPETRPIDDSLATLEKHIRQKEDGGGNLVVVAAGKQGNVNFNFVSFFVPQDVNVQPPKVSLIKVTDPVDTDEETAAVEGKLEQQANGSLHRTHLRLWRARYGRRLSGRSARRDPE